MNRYSILLIVLLFVSCVDNSQTELDSFDQKIRDSLCQITNGDYAGAQLNLEKTLQKEPRNIYAQRLWPGVLAQRIVKANKSPENISQIRITIAAYEHTLKTLPVTKTEITNVNNYVVGLYAQINQEEMIKELVTRAADTSKSAEDRSQYYVKLAAEDYKCVNEIINAEKKPSGPDIKAARTCLDSGTNNADQAVSLDDISEIAWSYKASLLLFASKIAELENNVTLKNSFQKQYAAASARFKELADKKTDELSLQKESDSKNDLEENISGELTEYKAEKSLDQLVKQIYIPFDLVSPFDPESDIGSGDGDNSLEKTADLQKHDWQEFSPKDDEIIVELPGNVILEPSGGSNFYRAASEGVTYQIMSKPQEPSQKQLNLDDAVLNTLAWSYVSTMRNFAVNMGGETLEVKLLKKETAGQQLARFYSYSLNSCAAKTDGMFIAVLGKGNNYILDIRGAGESNENVQHFLKSLRFK